MKNGGDLGWFTQSEMAEELVIATKGLDAGGISQPYKSKLGWNIIKLDEKTVVTAQPFDKIKGGLVSLLTRQKVQALVDELTAKAQDRGGRSGPQEAAGEEGQSAVGCWQRICAEFRRIVAWGNRVKTSPLAPATQPHLPPVAGVVLGVG